MTFKKLLSITFSVILIISLLASCKKPNSPTIENTSSKQEEEVKITLAETIEKTEVPALYKLGIDIKADASKAEIMAADDIVHIFLNMGENTQVVTFSVYENSVLGTSTVTGNALNYGILDGGQYYAVNLDTATLFIFEKSGELKKETKICDDPLLFGALNASGQYFVYQRKESSVINRYDLLTGKIMESEETFNITGTPVSDKDSVYVKDQSGKHYNISFEAFTIEKTRTEAFREYVDCFGFATEGEYFTYTALSNGIEKYMTKYLSAEEKVISAKEGAFITTPLNTHNCFRIYNTESGFATGEIQTGGIILDAQFVGTEYVFIALEDSNTSENFYRLFSIEENENKEIFEVGRLDEEVIYKNVFGTKETEASKEAKKLTDEYGIRFLYGKEGKDFKTDFTFAMADGVDVIPKLKVAQNVFDALPSELLLEATAGREIWVYFCTDLDNKGTEYSKLSVLTQLYNHKLILIDARCSEDRFAELLCHEFAHILDDYMSDSVKTGFSLLTPEHIRAAAYTNDYTKISSDQYTPYDEDKSNVWYYNNYCRINEKEDRTITLGQMFKNYVVKSTGEQFAYENIGKKAGYLSKALEETFDYCKETENQLWELAYPYSE